LVGNLLAQLLGEGDAVDDGGGHRAILWGLLFTALGGDFERAA